MATRVVTAHVPGDLAKKLDGLAELMDRPRGWLVKEAIATYIALEEQRHAQTLEALAEVDEGETVDHADIEAWASKLSTPAKKRRKTSAPDRS